MKIIIIGSKAYDSLEYNLHEAFSYAGHQCEIFDIYDRAIFSISQLKGVISTLDYLARRYSEGYDKRLFEKLADKIIDSKPDLVIGVYRFIHPYLVKRIKEKRIRVIHINPDQLTTLEYQQIFVEPYDAYFVKDKYMKNFMQCNMKLNVKLYNEAFNPRLHKKPQLNKSECENRTNVDVMTYGTMYPYRTRMLSELLKHDISLKVYGIKPHRFYNNTLDAAYQDRYITGVEKAQLLYGAKIVFNQMHYAEIESVNNRFFEVNGSGAFQLSDYRPILNDLLPIDPSLVSFKSIDEGVDKIKYYLNHPNERYEIVEKVYTHFSKYYSYDNLIKYIIEETFA